ncbi:MAG: hypothetical protein RJQ08_13460 [Salinisphaeraceae bacterium]
MGEIAEMMLEGLLDEETGEYIGDINKGIYGTESPGFPISYERGHSSRQKRVRVSCPECGKRVKEIGLWQHRRDAHGNGGDRS